MPFPNTDVQFKAGKSGNPKGNALDRHSTRSIDNWINQLLNDETFTATIREGLEIKEYKGAPIKAIIGAQIHLAVNGDTKSADMLFKHGLTKKTEIDITTNGESVVQPIDQNMLTQFLMNIQENTKR